MTICVNDEQPEKAESAIFVTDSGIFNSVNSEQPEKACSPIDFNVCESSKMTFSKLEQSWNEEGFISVTKEGIIICLSFLQPVKKDVSMTWWFKSTCVTSMPSLSAADLNALRESIKSNLFSFSKRSTVVT